MSDSELYSRLLFPKKQGYPLFYPQPFDSLPEPARRTGTEIGDVGVVTVSGAFDSIFNILRAGDDPANRFGVPTGFEPVVLGLDDITTQMLYHLPGSDISNTTINKKRLDIDAGVENNVFLPLGAGAVVEVSTNSKQTGLLLLPDGASRWDLLPLRVFRDYALKHGQNWYAFINGHLGRMIGSGELYLVTGVTKSTSWSVAAVENQSSDGKVALKLKAAQVGNAGASCTWEWESASSSVNSGPRRRLGEESWRDNQTVFLRGFKVALRSAPLRRSPKVLSIVNAKWSDMTSKTTSMPFSQSRAWHSSVNTPPPQSPPSTPGSSSQASDDEQSMLDYVPNLYHPSDAINECLLDCAPDAMIAVTHDDEWGSVLNEADKDIPEKHQLMSRISNKFNIEITSDGVCLQAPSRAQIQDIRDCNDQPSSIQFPANLTDYVLTDIGNSDQKFPPSLTPFTPPVERLYTPIDDRALPTLQSQTTKDVLQSVLNVRKTWKTLRGGETVWTLDLEAALLEGLENYRPDDSRETRMLGRFPMRNRFISDYIFEKTGKRRSAKQVGSRLQQLRESCGNRKLLHLLSPFRQPAHPESSFPGVSSSVGERDFPDASSPQHTVMYIDIIPQDSPDDVDVASPTMWSNSGEVVPASDRPRRLRTINPTVAFMSQSPVAAHSRFTVYSEDLALHAETEPLTPVMDPAARVSGFLYSTTLVPQYWKVILESSDPTRFIIYQEVVKDDTPAVVFSATYKFRYPAGHSPGFWDDADSNTEDTASNIEDDDPMSDQRSSSTFVSSRASSAGTFSSINSDFSDIGAPNFRQELDRNLPRPLFDLKLRRPDFSPFDPSTNSAGGFKYGDARGQLNLGTLDRLARPFATVSFDDAAFIPPPPLFADPSHEMN